MSERVPDEVEQTATMEFTPQLKLKALHLLLRYSLKSRKKWAKIRTEIVNLYPIKDGANSDMLSRQSLEAWAAGGDIGDQKFKIIYHFLTHQKTLNRPEFADALDFLHPEENTLRGGRLLRSLYGFEMPNIDEILPTPHEQLIENGHDPFDAYCSLSFGNFGDVEKSTEYCLSINRIKGEQFFIAHLLSWPIGTRPLQGKKDHNIKRLSGLGTLNGTHIKFHFRDFEEGGGHFVLASDRWDSPGYDIVLDKILIEAVYLVRQRKETKFGLKYLDANLFHIRLAEQEDQFIEKFIDNFRWSALI